MERHVMAFYTPTPGTVGRRRAEDREEIPLGIAHHGIPTPSIIGAARRFEGSENRLEIHDRRRRQISPLAETGFEQLASELALRLAHRFDGEALARKHVGWNEMPVGPLIPLDRKRGLLALL